MFTIEGVISRFRKEYTGSPIAFMVLGGGFSALDFRRYPGSSKFFHTAIEPYNNDTANFLNRFVRDSSNRIDDPNNFRAVNPEVTEELLQGLQHYCNDDPNLLYVVINSALTTEGRWRRGTNRSFIATSRGDMYEYSLTKIEEDEYNILNQNHPELIDQIRFGEDVKVGQTALAVILENPSLLPVLGADEKIIRLHKTASGGRVGNPSDTFSLTVP